MAVVEAAAGPDALAEASEDWPPALSDEEALLVLDAEGVSEEVAPAALDEALSLTLEALFEAFEELCPQAERARGALQASSRAPAARDADTDMEDLSSGLPFEPMPRASPEAGSTLIDQ